MQVVKEVRLLGRFLMYHKIKLDSNDSEWLYKNQHNFGIRPETTAFDMLQDHLNEDRLDIVTSSSALVALGHSNIPIYRWTFSPMEMEFISMRNVL